MKSDESPMRDVLKKSAMSNIFAFPDDPKKARRIAKIYMKI